MCRYTSALLLWPRIDCFSLFYVTDHTGMSTQFYDGDHGKKINFKNWEIIEL